MPVLEIHMPILEIHMSVLEIHMPVLVLGEVEQRWLRKVAYKCFVRRKRNRLLIICMLQIYPSIEIEIVFLLRASGSRPIFKCPFWGMELSHAGGKDRGDAYMYM